MYLLSILSLVILLPPIVYLFCLAIASIRSPAYQAIENLTPQHRFAIAIPAHDEENVISRTIEQLLMQSYPSDLYQIFVIADHCSDNTASLARNAGAIALERMDGSRCGKGSALIWAFPQIFERCNCDAIVIFDADTLVDNNFLQAIDNRLKSGARVIQGQHIISNPEQGWFPSLTYAMFLIDNRYQNLGRTTLGLSAKNMGDSICFRGDVVRKIGYGTGLTDDYLSRQKLLLEGINIVYEPLAIGYGEAPVRWSDAVSQRKRWLQGTCESSRSYSRRMLTSGLKRNNLPLIDGALQSLFPSYSTITLFVLLLLGAHIFFYLLTPPNVQYQARPPIAVLGILTFLLFIYPFIGLFLEKAPLNAYLVILTGPFYIIWRTILAILTRSIKRSNVWVRTTHGDSKLHVK